MHVGKHIRIPPLYCYLLKSEGQCVAALPQDLHNCSIHSLIHWPPNIVGKLRSQGALLQDYQLVQSLAHIWLFVTPWTTACQASLSITNSWRLHKLMSIASVMPSNCLILCRPLLFMPSIFPSIRVFSSELVFPIRWPKYWSFSFSISPLNEYSGLISFRMNWLDLLAVQGTFRSLLQHHSSKASILWCSAFFKVQLSHPYMTTGKTIALSRWTFVGKVMSLLFKYAVQVGHSFSSKE